MTQPKSQYKKKSVPLYVSEEFVTAVDFYRKSMNENIRKKNSDRRVRVVTRNDLFIEALQQWADKTGLKCRVDYREMGEE